MRVDNLFIKMFLFEKFLEVYITRTLLFDILLKRSTASLHVMPITRDAKLHVTPGYTWRQFTRDASLHVTTFYTFNGQFTRSTAKLRVLLRKWAWKYDRNQIFFSRGYRHAKNLKPKNE